MRTIYFDCFAGISGDMTVGALLDLGVDFEELKRQLAMLGLSGYELSAERVKRSGFAAIKFNVMVTKDAQPHRHLSDIVALITDSHLSESVKKCSIRVFERLATAEARVHGSTIEEVHFHEVGAVDSILDIVGAAIAFELLGVEKILTSPLRVGFGTINIAHGSLSVPAPGTAELLRGLPVYAGDREGEFVTPTGAALITTLAESSAAMPAMRIVHIGYGAGTRNPEGFPNVLRAVLGEVEDVAAKPVERVIVIETNIDDMNPQAYGFVLERAFTLGALDAFISPVQMKKNRPGVLLTFLCEESRFEALVELLLTETTTLGVRYYEAARKVLARTVKAVETPYGKVRIKVATDGDRRLHAQPEYEDCIRLATQSGVSFLEVQSAASAAYRETVQRENGKLKEEDKS